MHLRLSGVKMPSSTTTTTSPQAKDREAARVPFNPKHLTFGSVLILVFLRADYLPGRWKRIR